MRRRFALTLLFAAASAIANAQIHGVPPSVTSFGPGRGPNPGVRASITSLGPNGFGDGFFDQGFENGIRFGNHPPFLTSFPQHLHHRRRPWPLIWGLFYSPYYGLDYFGFNSYDPNAYPQQPQPTVVVMDPRSSDDRYGDHAYDEQRSTRAPVQAQNPPASPEEQEPTVLIFRDGHKQEVRNYAIVGQTLWDLGAKGITHKIPLSDLDVDSTRKVNDDRGVEFVLPKS